MAVTPIFTTTTYPATSTGLQINNGGPRQYQIAALGLANPVSATVQIEVTNDPAMGWLPLGVITCSAASPAPGGLSSAATWPYVRAGVSAGVATSVSVNMSTV